jgi:hypothetical protein
VQNIPKDGAFVPGEILVQWQDGLQKENLTAALDVDWSVKRTLEPLRVALVQVPKGEELAAIAQLEDMPSVVYAEPNYLGYALDTGDEPAPEAPKLNFGASPLDLSTPGIQPNDTYWLDQWAARRVQAPTAWETSTGSAAVTVAVIDSGIDLGHPEFAGRILPGFDYIQWDTQPQDENGHGTHVAGLIAATGDNARGIAGLNWNVQILPLRVLDRYNSLSDVGKIADAVLNASRQNVTVINLSLAITGQSTTLHNAIIQAHNNNIVIIAAAGNEAVPGQPLPAVRYPAAYPEVIAVAATNRWDDWSGYANGGSALDVAAPGGVANDAVISTSLGGSYAYQYGTSMATPHVAAGAALIRALNPDLSNITVAGILRNTADKVGSFPYVNGRNNWLGYGRINLAKALRQALPAELLFTPNMLAYRVAPGQLGPAQDITLYNPSSQPIAWQIIEVSHSWLQVEPPLSGNLFYPNTAKLKVRLSSLPALGTHYAFLRIRSTDLGGHQRTFVLSIRVQVVSQLHQQFLPVLEHDYRSNHWIDTSAGIPLSLGSDDVAIVPLPFTFPYYDRAYNQAWVHANGFISFGEGFAGSQYAQNTCIPSVALPNGSIYALWDDLDPVGNGQVRYLANGDSQLVIAWENVPRSGDTVPNTFQVVLRPDGHVTITYRAVSNPSSATVGLENWDATMGWQTVCNGSDALPELGQSIQYFTAYP